jgi:alkanesulfonate monooxygenase SsuD/methylene tetrahydromethanopterin reductase-like flavin-dependent oxidoreductase (luciferase family)
MDPASGLFVDPALMHGLDHRGDFPRVKGPLNVARPVQGWPVIVQAGASEAGRQIAAETAEMVFGAASIPEAARAFSADVKGRMPAAGRDPEHLTILPGCLVVLGETEDEARTEKARLDDLVHPDSALANLSARLGVDASGFDLDAPLPVIPVSNAGKSGQVQIVDDARRTGATVRDLARKVGGDGGLPTVGTADQVAERMEAWLETRACDGFNGMVPFVPEGLDDGVDRLVPERSGADSSAAITPAPPCATISARRARGTASSRRTPPRRAGARRTSGPEPCPLAAPRSAVAPRGSPIGRSPAI